MEHLRNQSFMIISLYIQNFHIVPIEIVIEMHPMNVSFIFILYLLLI